jgi:hypothetical protein
MSEKFTGLFRETSKDAAISSARSLAGTAQLTTLATTIAGDIIKELDANFDRYKELVNASKADHGAMDELVNEAYDLNKIDVSFLRELDENTIDGMLKSQQSKRSRTKSKVMTMDNYKTLMVGAIAENLIRIATGKEKQAGGLRRPTGSLEYSAERIAEFENNPDALRKEIRNVQSKKSIMKAREDFREDDPRWSDLLEVEAMLKNLRGDSTKTIVVDETKDKLQELLNGVDIKSLKPADAKKLIEQAAALINNQAPAEDDKEDAGNDAI